MRSTNDRKMSPLKLASIVLLFTTYFSQNVYSQHDQTVVIDRVVAFPEPNDTDSILLRNLGDESVDLRDWGISDVRKNKTDPTGVYFFGSTERCRSYSALPAGGSLLLTPLTHTNPCGFPFGISNEDQLHLFNKNDETVGFVAWNWSLPGLAFRRSKDDTYDYRAENKPAAEVMEDQGNLTEFIKALQVTEQWETVYKQSGIKRSELFQSFNELIPFQMDTRPRLRRNQTILNSFLKSLPQNEVIFPTPGRLTVLCPTDEAMEDFYQSGILGETLSADEIRSKPEFQDLVKFHIIPGEWMSGSFIDGVSMRTSLKDSNLTITRTGHQTLFTGHCRTQEDSSGSCVCTRDSCSEVIDFDLFAANGVIHIIDRVLLPEFLVQDSEEDIIKDLDSQMVNIRDSEMVGPAVE